MIKRIRPRIAKQAAEPAAGDLLLASGPRPPLTAAEVMHARDAWTAPSRPAVGSALSSPRPGPVWCPRPAGPWLTTTPALARQVLTDAARFDFPGDVSRSGDLSASRGDTRSGHVTFAPLTPDQVATGLDIFAAEWAAASTEHDRATPAEPYDAMVLLRRPVARSTWPRCSHRWRRPAGPGRRPVLAWIDALAPVIAARRPPRRWSRARRAERDARFAAEDALAGSPRPRRRPAAWRGHARGRHPGADRRRRVAARLGREPPPGDADPVHAVWETLRLTPPTWITARITTEEVDLDGTACLRLRGAGQSAAPRPAGDAGSGRGPRPRRVPPGSVAGRRSAPRRLAAVRCRAARLPGPQPRHGAARPPGRVGSVPGARAERARRNRPEPGLAPAPCRFTVAARGKRLRDRPPRPAGHIVGRARAAGGRCPRGQDPRRRDLASTTRSPRSPPTSWPRPGSRSSPSCSPASPGGRDGVDHTGRARLGPRVVATQAPRARSSRHRAPGPRPH